LGSFPRCAGRWVQLDCGSSTGTPTSDAILLGHRTNDLDEGAAADLARLPNALRQIDAATMSVDRGGLDWDQFAAVLEPLAQSPQLLGLSLADFRPDLDPTGEFARRVLDVL